eukprot:SAG25_NODE_27_length_21065_cov_19.427931_13_plen_197_part_00
MATFVQSNEGNAVSWKSTQLRRIALYFRLALLELRDNSSADSDLVAAVDEGVLNPDERDVLLKTSDRASLVMLWLIDAWVTRNKLENGVDVPAPVLTRSFQLLSEASVGRDMLGKIQNTPFPFPFVQVRACVRACPRARVLIRWRFITKHDTTTRNSGVLVHAGDLVCHATAVDGKLCREPDIWCVLLRVEIRGCS